MKIGTRVRVERDETLYPSRGTWPRFRGRRGVVTGTSMGEIGVSFSTDPNNPTDAWFQRYELKAITGRKK